MENSKKIKIALVRGDSLNEWEGMLWENLGDNFEVVGFASERNLYNDKNLNYSVKRLPTSSDNFFVSNYKKYINGVFQEMTGMEDELIDFNIAHTAELSYFYTMQAIRAKEKNKNLKVVATIWDNSFGRFEYNYWLGLAMPPKYWREKINNIIKENISGVDMFLPVTEYSKEMLLDYGVPEEKIKILTPAIVMPNDVDDNILEEMDLSGKEIYMVVNRMVKEKGVYDVFYGWKIYLHENSDKNKILLIIGDGPERNNLMRLASEHSIDASIKFIQQLPNQKVRQLSKHAKCLILGSLATPVWQEQFGYVLAEAIINNCPVVSTYSGAIPEVIGSAGILFSPGNPVELKKALVKLDDENTYKTLKENCEIEKKRFEVNKFREELSSLYKKLVN